MSDEAPELGTFADNAITALGEALISKALVGQEIRFTRIVLGDGYMPAAQSPQTMTDVVSPRVEVPITKCELNSSGDAVVGGRWDNSRQTEGFHWRELALYAEDPDAGEVLYSYGNSGGTAEWIPAASATVVEKLIDVITFVGYATNVTAVFDPSYNVSIDIDDYMAAITDPEIDDMWGTTGGIVGPGGETVTVVGMTEPEIDDIFEDEEGA